MTEEKTDSEEAFGEERPGLAPWQKIALIVAAVFIVIGAGLSFASDGSERESAAKPPIAGETGLVPQGLAPGTVITPGETVDFEQQEESGLGSWSPFFLKNGLSFFVAFCIGYALRSFFKVSAFVLGIVFLAIFGLSYAGIVEVDWSTLEGHWDSLTARLSEETKQFKTFIMGSLPSASLGGLGLIAGFRR